MVRYSDQAKDDEFYLKVVWDFIDDGSSKTCWNVEGLSFFERYKLVVYSFVRFVPDAEDTSTEMYYRVGTKDRKTYFI